MPFQATMIPPSSLARLVLGYLEEEGLQNTIKTFYQEHHQILLDQQRDPFVQTPSLKTILEDYIVIKQTESKTCPEDVVPSLWKNLDVLIGQLKYHTIAHPVSLKPLKQNKKKGYHIFYNAPQPRPSKTRPSYKDNRTTSKHRSKPTGNQGTEHGILWPVQPVFVSGIHVPQLSTNREVGTDPASDTAVPGSLGTRDITTNSVSALTTLTPTAEGLTQTSGNHSAAIHIGTSMCKENVEVHKEDMTLITVGMDRNVQEMINTTSTEGIEMFTKSPKRKGNQPKKRFAAQPSPAKMLLNEVCPSDGLDLQFLDGDKGIDAAMPILLDTFLNTPLLQEKLAENINKIVGSSKPGEVQDKPMTQTVETTSVAVEDPAKDDQHTEIPVDDILSLLEADPAFESFFSMLSADVPKGPSPTKDSTSTASSTTSNVSSSEQSGSSLVTESLLLLSSSPSKLSTSTSVTCTLQNAAPLLASKPLTPENPSNQETVGSSGCITNCFSDVHVRSLFTEKEKSPDNLPSNPKVVKSKKPKNHPDVTAPKGRIRCRKKPKKKPEVVKHRKLLLPNLATQPHQPAANMLQSLVSAHRDVPTLDSSSSMDGTNLAGARKIGGTTMLQLLQDAAAVQKTQGTPQDSHTAIMDTTNNLLLLPPGKSHVQEPEVSCTVLSLPSNELAPRGQGIQRQECMTMSQTSGIPHPITSMQREVITESPVAAVGSYVSTQPYNNPGDLVYSGQPHAHMPTTLTTLVWPNPLMCTAPIYTNTASVPTPPMQTTPLLTTSMLTPSIHTVPMLTTLAQNAPGQPLTDQAPETTNSRLNTRLPSTTNVPTYGLDSINSSVPYSSSSTSNSGSFIQNENRLERKTILQAHKAVNSAKLMCESYIGSADQRSSVLGSGLSTGIDKTLCQTFSPTETSGQNESWSLNPEECVHSFCQISEHGKPSSQQCHQILGGKSDVATKGKHTKNTEAKKAIKEEASNGDHGVMQAVNYKADSPALSCHSTDSVASTEERNEQTQGVKRQGSTDLKENEPKRTKGSRSSKKSKKKKKLPKDFDVERFLSRLHYIEK